MFICHAFFYFLDIEEEDGIGGEFLVAWVGYEMMEIDRHFRSEIVGCRKGGLLGLLVLIWTMGFGNGI